jgi:hypothetical protein
MYQLVCTISMGIWVMLKQSFHSLLELTRVFAGTFTKDKQGVADIPADLRWLCGAKTNRPRTDR